MDSPSIPAAAHHPITPDWVRDAVFYQVFPDRFARSDRVAKPGPIEPWDSPPTVHGFKGGDLLGVVDHLDHIAALGATAIYLNPVFQSASNHRYHTYDYLAVDPLLGGTPALRELIDACHARGMRVVLDGVFNHSGRGFWPFHHVLETGWSSPYRDWFYVNRPDLEAGRPLRAYPTHGVTPDRSEMPAGREAGSASLRMLGYRAWWDLPALPKLNIENPRVRDYLLDVGEHWIRFGADGWRLDVPEELPDWFWRAFRDRIKGVNPEAYIVAEIWREKPGDLTGDMYDALMNYDLGTAIISFAGGPRLDRRVVAQHGTLAAAIGDDDGPAFARRLERALTIYDPAVTTVQLNLLGSHDTPRVLSMVGGDVPSVRLATLIQMTLPGAPSIYYGDEIGMRGELDPGCRGAFPWDHPERWDRAILALTAGAIAFRHANPVLRHAGFRLVAAVGRTVAYLRGEGAGAVLVLVNAGDDPCRLRLDVPELDGRSLAASPWASLSPDALEAPARVSHGTIEVEVKGRDGAVVLAT